MASTSSKFALENGLDLKKVVSTGSVLHINYDGYDETDCPDFERSESRRVDLLGQPVPNFSDIERHLITLDENGYVKKKIIEEGGGLPLLEDCTVSVAFSGYWENELEPFDSRKLHKPLVVNLKENGLLPGLQMAIRSMLVGETSLFLFTHQVMYGEMGVPPRIKPKAKCAFFIKLIKSILTSAQGQINFSEPNQFELVLHEAKLLYSSGSTLFNSNNIPAAIQLFKKAVYMLHKCRLADEKEEKIQENMLQKLYLNLAICYNKNKQPLKACCACNELNRMSRLWNNDKALFQNAKALRMIGDFDGAECRLKRSMKLHGLKSDINPRQAEVFSDEVAALQRAREDKANLIKKVSQGQLGQVTDEFKKEITSLIRNFKENPETSQFILPSKGLNSSEMAFIKQTCIQENVFLNKVKKSIFNDNEENIPNTGNILNSNENYVLDKSDNLSEKSNDSESADVENACNVSRKQEDDDGNEGKTVETEELVDNKKVDEKVENENKYLKENGESISNHNFLKKDSSEAEKVVYNQDDDEEKENKDTKENGEINVDHDLLKIDS